MTYDKPIVIEKINDLDVWKNFASVHARINKTGGKEYFKSGSERSQSTLTFEFRYFKDAENIRNNTQFFRIIYRGVPYNIVDYDDYMEKHQTVKLKGVSV